MLSRRALYATGNALLDAQADFRRARRSHAIARLCRWISRRPHPSRPVVLSQSIPLPGGEPRVSVIPLDAIVGTVEATGHFDARLRPASEAVRHRWERIALAHRRGIALPPVVLWARPEGYYIVDGRHRVSVARALGLADIDGWVSGPRRTTGQPPAECAAGGCQAFA